MLTYDDCVGLSDLTPEEIAVIAFHLHVPEIIAVQAGACLCRTPEGRELVQRISRRAVEEHRYRASLAALTRLRAERLPHPAATDKRTIQCKTAIA
jgi:hypothetical protein